MVEPVLVLTGVCAPLAVACFFILLRKSGVSSMAPGGGLFLMLTLMALVSALDWAEDNLGKVIAGFALSAATALAIGVGGFYVALAAFGFGCAGITLWLSKNRKLFRAELAAESRKQDQPS